MNLKHLIQLRASVEAAAEEQAKLNFEFATAGGNKMGLTEAQLEMVKASLIFYARNGAHEAIGYLERHGELKP